MTIPQAKSSKSLPRLYPSYSFKGVWTFLTYFLILQNTSFIFHEACTKSIIVYRTFHATIQRFNHLVKISEKVEISAISI